MSAALQLSLFDGQPIAIRIATPVNSKKPKPADSKKKALADWQLNCRYLCEQYGALHLWLLKRNLRILNDPQTSDQERNDILAWINASRTGDRLEAFSFAASVHLYDPRCDIDVLIALINQRSKKVSAS